MGCVIAGFVVVDKVFRQKEAREVVIRDIFFSDRPADAFDVIAFGPSYVYCTVNPVQLYRDTGLRSCIPGTSIQPVEMTCHYVRMALEKYRPQLVVLGASMFVFHKTPPNYREGYAHMATDPFPLGMDKIKMLRDQHLGDPIEDYLFPFIKYHSRWKELGKRDFGFFRITPDPKTGMFLGYQLNNRVEPNHLTTVDFSKMAGAPIAEEYLACLDKIVGMCREKGVKLLLLNSLRANALADGRLATLHRYARERGIDFLDLNEVFDKTGISNKTDFHDTGHLNIHGAEKATRYLGRYIQEHYSLKVCQSPEVREQWNAFCRKYDEVKKSVLSQRKK